MEKASSFLLSSVLWYDSPVCGAELAVPADQGRKRSFTLSERLLGPSKKAKVERTPSPSIAPIAHNSRIIDFLLADSGSKQLDEAAFEKEAESKATENQHSEELKAGEGRVVSEHPDNSSAAKDTADSNFEGEGSVDSDGESKPDAIHKLPGDGPHVFFTYADAMLNIIGGSPEEESAYLVLKSQMLGVLAKIEATQPLETEGDDDFMEDVGFWEVVMDPEATETEGAKMLEEHWDELREDPSWWLEVVVQREKPTKGTPALEIRFTMTFDKIAPESKGSWWITDIAIPDERSAKAAKIIEDNVPDYFLN